MKTTAADLQDKLVLCFNRVAVIFGGGGDGDVHDRLLVAWKRGDGERDWELVGQGSFLGVDRERVVAKRIVLTGHPYKIHKRLVTIRYMFFNTEDVDWFKAIPLYTKRGRSGFVKESLGTHGYFKATFDGTINPQDAVAISMFFRVIYIIVGCVANQCVFQHRSLQTCLPARIHGNGGVKQITYTHNIKKGLFQRLSFSGVWLFLFFFFSTRYILLRIKMYFYEQITTTTQTPPHRDDIMCPNLPR